jgi:hypothetical protein
LSATDAMQLLKSVGLESLRRTVYSPGDVSPTPGERR